MTTKTSKATLGDLRATPSFYGMTGDRVSFVSIHEPGGDTIARVCNGARDKQADADRIVACVNALDGIDDPEAFVEAAIKIHGFAASHTGNGCQTDTESRWAELGCNLRETSSFPGALAQWVDALRAALGGEPTTTEDDR